MRYFVHYKSYVIDNSDEFETREEAIDVARGLINGLDANDNDEAFVMCVTDIISIPKRPLEVKKLVKGELACQNNVNTKNV